MTTLADVAEQLKVARQAARMSQSELAQRAGVARTTLTRMETLAKGDMSVSALVAFAGSSRLRSKVVKVGHHRTLEDTP
jgi:DNA-binding XRE family transcriptional regulator